MQIPILKHNECASQNIVNVRQMSINIGAKNNFQKRHVRIGQDIAKVKAFKRTFQGENRTFDELCLVTEVRTVQKCTNLADCRRMLAMSLLSLSEASIHRNADLRQIVSSFRVHFFNGTTIRPKT